MEQSKRTSRGEGPIDKIIGSTYGRMQAHCPTGGHGGDGKLYPLAMIDVQLDITHQPETVHERLVDGVHT